MKHRTAEERRNFMGRLAETKPSPEDALAAAEQELRKLIFLGAKRPALDDAAVRVIQCAVEVGKFAVNR